MLRLGSALLLSTRHLATRARAPRYQKSQGSQTTAVIKAKDAARKQRRRTQQQHQALAETAKTKKTRVDERIGRRFQLDEDEEEPEEPVRATRTKSPRGGRQSPSPNPREARARLALATNREGIRLNKALPNHSRREADRMIHAGRLTVNGVRALPGTRVGSQDAINLDGTLVAGAIEHISRELGEDRDLEPTSAGNGPISLYTELFSYLKYYKPAGVTTTVERSDRTNMIDVARLGKLGKRVFPVGRLDKDSTGLLLVTADGRLPDAMLNSKQGISKSYTVTTKRRVSDAAVAKLRSGVSISTPKQRDNNSKSSSSQKTSWVTSDTAPAKVTRVGGSDSPQLRFVISEGRNRQIRRMMEAVNHEVVGLHRDKFGDITLKGLQEGEWCECSASEQASILQALRRSANE